jgi:hypothetical protein
MYATPPTAISIALTLSLPQCLQFLWGEGIVSCLESFYPSLPSLLKIVWIIIKPTTV